MESFHFDGWMLSIVRWAPVMSPSYPSDITFWVKVGGVPLHFWAVETFTSVGKRLGRYKEGDVDLTNGRVRVMLNAFDCLFFESNVDFGKGETSIVSLRYEKLHGYCRKCFSLCRDSERCGEVEGPDFVQLQETRGFSQANVMSYKGALKQSSEKERKMERSGAKRTLRFGEEDSKMLTEDRKKVDYGRNKNYGGRNKEYREYSGRESRNHRQSYGDQGRNSHYQSHKEFRVKEVGESSKSGHNQGIQDTRKGEVGLIQSNGQQVEGSEKEEGEVGAKGEAGEDIMGKGNLENVEEREGGLELVVDGNEDGVEVGDDISMGMIEEDGVEGQEEFVDGLEIEQVGMEKMEREEGRGEHVTKRKLLRVPPGLAGLSLKKKSALGILSPRKQASTKHHSKAGDGSKQGGEGKRDGTERKDIPKPQKTMEKK